MTNRTATYLNTEPLSQALARGDCVLRCTFTAGPDPRFLDPAKYELEDGTLASEVREVGGGLHIVFPRAIGPKGVWL